MALSSWTAAVDDPAWMPYVYDERADTLQFVHLTREAQRAAPFLDPRCLASAQLSQPLPMAQAPNAAIDAAARPVHFIFHTAFCCSTLLTRALDIPGVAMGQKEPFVLVGFSTLDPAARQRPQVGAALRASVNLLSRPLAAGEVQIAKPSNIANVVASQIMAAHPQSKALVLHSGLPEFLRSMARQGLQGRIFGRQLFQRLAPSLALQPQSAVELFEQTDLQIAAQAWLMQARALSALSREFGPRVRSLSSKALLADKTGALIKLGAFFDLKADDAQWRAIAEGPVFARDSKRPDEAFDAATRAARQDAAEAHAEEIAMITKWAEMLAARSGAPLNLGDTLLAP